MKPFCYLSYRPKFSGYGYGTEEFAKAFRRRGFKFTYSHDAHMKKNSVKEDIVIHSGFPHFFRLDRKKINIARVMLESDSLPRLWVDVMNSMDEVWAASRFNARTFKNAGVDPSRIYVIPDIADGRFALAARRTKRKRGGAFRFLSVFLDLSLRKGYDLMLSEFTRNFSGRKDVEWVVQCSAGAAAGLRALLEKMQKKGVDIKNIKVTGKRPSIDELARLYLSADCYILPTRGEGFGRPYLEAASAGLPVIATGFGGQRDFLNPKNSRLLDYRLVKVPAPEALDCYFLTGHRWAQPSRADLSRALHEALKGALKRPGREPVDLSPFTEERVADLIADRLENVKKNSTPPKKFEPQIITYDEEWCENMPTPREFIKKLKRTGKTIGIAGTGKNALSLHRFLERNGFKVPFFIDRKEGYLLKKKIHALGGLPRTGPKADLVLISSYPGAFAELKELLKDRFATWPVIFYEKGSI